MIDIFLKKLGKQTRRGDKSDISLLFSMPDKILIGLSPLNKCSDQLLTKHGHYEIQCEETSDVRYIGVQWYWTKDFGNMLCYHCPL